MFESSDLFYCARVNTRDTKSFSSDDIFDCGFKKVYLFFVPINYQKCACEIQHTLRFKIFPLMSVMFFYYAGVNKRDIKSFSSDDIFDCGFKKMYLFFFINKLPKMRL